MLRLVGTWARPGSLLASSTTGQQDVTEPPIVIVPVAVLDPTTLVGFTVSAESVFAAVDKNSRDSTVAPA